MIVSSLPTVLADIKANPGKHYAYVLHRPCGAPFYVGVGTGRRIKLHSVHAANGKAAPRFDVIRQIVATGGSVGYSIVGWFDDWTGAAIEERRLISLHGRLDIGTGLLVNQTNGGQGTAGLKWHASAARVAGAEKAAAKNRGRKHSVEHREKQRAAMKAVRWSAETVAKRAAALSGRKISVEMRQRLSDAAKKRPMPAAILAAGEAWRAANVDRISEVRKAKWSDPKHRTRMTAALKGVKRSTEYVEANKARQIAKFSDPDFRERWAAARAAGFERWRKRRQQDREKPA